MECRGIWTTLNTPSHRARRWSSGTRTGWSRRPSRRRTVGALRWSVCPVDPLNYQRQAVAQAPSKDNLRPRFLIADAVGLGKTLEIGMVIAELARRGRAERVLVVTPRHVLEQTAPG